MPVNIYQQIGKEIAVMYFQMTSERNLDRKTNDWVNLKLTFDTDTIDLKFRKLDCEIWHRYAHLECSVTFLLSSTEIIHFDVNEWGSFFSCSNSFSYHFN